MSRPSLFRIFQCLLLPVLAGMVLSGCGSTPDAGYGYPPGSNYYQGSSPAYSGLPSSRPPSVYAESYILVDADSGQVLASKNPDTRRPVASTQKLLTALVIAESGGLSTPVQLTRSDVSVERTVSGFRAGTTLTRQQMLGCMLVKSCNDLAVALARDNAGSVAAFAHQMNRRAQSLGCTNSQFSNPHGLTAAYNSSSARDMARIGMAAWRNPYIRNLASRTSFSAGGRTFLTTNDLLKTMPECQGMKTGYTRAADRCLVSVATRQGKTVLLVQLGTQTKYIWNDGRALMNWGLNS